MPAGQRDSIARLLAPRSIAIIGASEVASKTSGRPLEYLTKHRFAGQIYPVNPRVSEIRGLPCYRDVSLLPQAPDVGIVLLGADHAAAAVAALRTRGAAAAVVIAGGYAEIGEAGVERQQALRAAAGTMRLLGPNTIGLVNLTDRVTLSASGALELDELAVGNVAVVSQSGGILGSILSRAAARGIGFSKLVATGNEIDLEVADFVDYLVDDPATRVIMLYIETLRQPEKFVRAAIRARAAGKPIVAFKVGRSAAGAAAAVSHTGAIAGSDRMYDALFARTGVVRVLGFSDLIDVAAGLQAGRSLRGGRVAILTSTGGAGALVAEGLGVAGFEMPPPDAGTAAALRAPGRIDAAAFDRNPIDVTLAGLQPDVLRTAIRTLLASPAYDALVVVVGSSALAQPTLMADAIAEGLPGTDKPVLAYVSPHAPEVARVLAARGIPALVAPEACATVLDVLRRAGMPPPATTASIDGAGPVDRAEPIDRADGSDAADEESARAIAALRAEVGTLAAGSMDEHRAKALFALAGIPATREIEITDRSAAAAAVATHGGGPVVLKIQSRTNTHNSDIGGVAVGVPASEVEARIDEMRERVRAMTGSPPSAWLVQEQ
ncbi:MAG: acetate--CoA ligase family protein, partial [Lautropia sp.]